MNYKGIAHALKTVSDVWEDTGPAVKPGRYSLVSFSHKF